MGSIESRLTTCYLVGLKLHDDTIMKNLMHIHRDCAVRHGK